MKGLERFLRWLAARPIFLKISLWLLLAGASFVSFAAVFYWLIFAWLPGSILKESLICAGLIMIFTVTHELGHLIGAKLTGVPTCGLYFLPLLGAAAIIDKKKKPLSRWKDLFFSLAGPLLGLLIILPLVALNLTNFRPILTSLIIWISISLYNLFPIYPFDGGRVVLDILASFLKERMLFKISRILGIFLQLLITGLLIWAFFSIRPVSFWLAFLAVSSLWLPYLLIGKGRIVVEDRIGKPMRKPIVFAMSLFYLAIFGGYLVIFLSIWKF